MLSAIQAILALLENGIPTAQEVITSIEALVPLAKQEYMALIGDGPSLTTSQQQTIDASYQASVTALQNAAAKTGN